MDVLRAVTQNGRQLMLTVYLLVIVIWFFAIWGSHIRENGERDGRSDFLVEVGTNEPLCATPGHCWLEIVRLGMGSNAVRKR